MIRGKRGGGERGGQCQRPPDQGRTGPSSTDPSFANYHRKRGKQLEVPPRASCRTHLLPLREEGGGGRKKGKKRRGERGKYTSITSLYLLQLRGGKKKGGVPVFGTSLDVLLRREKGGEVGGVPSNRPSLCLTKPPSPPFRGERGEEKRGVAP